jgi:hypothetical protein
VKPADVLADCAEDDPSARHGQAPDSCRSDGVTSEEPAAHAHRILVHRRAGAVPPTPSESNGIAVTGQRMAIGFTGEAVP